MYANRNHVRTVEVKARFNADEKKLLDAVAEYNQMERAVLVRELVLAGIERLKADNTAQLKLSA